MMIGTAEQSLLSSDGDTITLDDGRILRLRIEPDEWQDISDFGDCYGMAAWTEKDRCTGRDKPRPRATMVALRS